MGGVRNKKSRRKATINSTTYSKRLKRKQKKKVTIECGFVRDLWDHKKSLKQNMSAIGIAYDVNKALPITSSDATTKQMEFGNVSDYKTGTTTIGISPEGTDVEMPSEKKVHMSVSEAKFIAALMHKYGNNFKDMVRDKSNYNQLTWCQLEKKCELFKLSRHSMNFSSQD